MVPSKCWLVGWIIRMLRMAYWVLVVRDPLYKLNNQSLDHSLCKWGRPTVRKLMGRFQKFRLSFPLSITTCEGLCHTTAPVAGSWPVNNPLTEKLCWRVSCCLSLRSRSSPEKSNKSVPKVESKKNLLLFFVSMIQRTLLQKWGKQFSFVSSA